VNARAALSTVLGALVVFLVATIVDRHVLQPRREATKLVAEARPLVASTNEAQWLQAESLLAQAELRQHGRADIAELRGLIVTKRLAARAKDEEILTQALNGCLGGLDKIGRVDDAKAIRAEIGKSTTRDLHVRCMRVQLEHLDVAKLGPAPSVSVSASASASTKSP